MLTVDPTTGEVTVQAQHWESGSVTITCYAKSLDAIKYQDATGTNVTADKITDTQRQNLADYYAELIKSYMTKIPHDKQVGICKGNMADTSDPVGLWSIGKSKDWTRTATYKAFCDALGGQ